MIDWHRLADRANADGEFRLHSRFWNATVDVVDTTAGGGARLQLTDGAVSVTAEPGGTQAAPDLLIAAPKRDWDEMLKPVPRPFYHDPAAARAHHELVIDGDLAHRTSYYPAIRRLIELMRENRNGESTV